MCRGLKSESHDWLIFWPEKMVHAFARTLLKKTPLCLLLCCSAHQPVTANLASHLLKELARTYARVLVVPSLGDSANRDL